MNNSGRRQRKVGPITGHAIIPQIAHDRNLSGRRLPPLNVTSTTHKDTTTQSYPDKQDGDRLDIKDEKEDVPTSDKDEESSDNKSTIVPLFGSYRLTLSLTCMLVTTCLSLLRADMSVAIICMVKRPELAGNASSLILSINDTRMFQDLSLLSRGTNGSSLLNDSAFDNETRTEHLKPTTLRPFDGDSGEFDWSRVQQGYILSAYYYGYILTQIPGGWLSTRIGSKTVLNVGLLVGIICTLLTPVAARTSYYFILLCRFLVGFSMGVFLPAVHSIWGRWAPPMERSLLIVLSQSGIDLGGVIAMLVSGYLCQLPVDNGWTLIFYVYGIFASIVLLLFSYVAYSTPNEHPRMSEVEKDYINESIGTHVNEKTATPWKRILLSPAVYAIIIGHTCTNWGFYLFVSCIPMYISDVFKTGTNESGLLSSLPFVCTFFVSLVGCQAADFLRSRHVLSTASVRKLFQFSGQVIPAAAVVMCGYAGDPLTAVALLTVGVGFTGLTRSGYSCNHVDIAPKLAGILIGLSNTVATIPGMIGPIIVGELTTNGTIEEWRIVFYLIGVVYVFGAVVYCLLAKGHELNWAGNSVKPTEIKVTDPQT